MAQLNPMLQGLSQAAVKVLAGALTFQVYLEQNLLPRLLGVFWQDLAPHGLSGGECKFFAGCLPEAIFPSRQCGSLHQSKYVRRAGENTSKREISVFCNLTTEVHPITFAIFYRLEVNLLVWLTHKGRRSLGGCFEASHYSPLIFSPVSHPLIPAVF